MELCLLLKVVPPCLGIICGILVSHAPGTTSQVAPAAFTMVRSIATLASFKMETVLKADFQCAVLCARDQQCKAFSITKQPDAGDLVCQLSESVAVNLDQLGPANAEVLYHSEAAVSAGALDPSFKYHENASVISPQAVTGVVKPAHCGLECQRLPNCPGSSISFIPAKSIYECRIAILNQTIQWAKNSSAQLFWKTPQKVITGGFKLLADGKFHIVIQQYLTITQAIQACTQRGAVLMAFYPQARVSILDAFVRSQPGFNQITGWAISGVGIGTSDGKLYIPAYNLTISPALTVDQPWSINPAPALSLNQNVGVELLASSTMWLAKPETWTPYYGCTM